jgi:aspartyl-tRNA synthetase
MISGLERYFQIARCFRDEDQRADRQPDFTQLDIEMSFVELEDVLDLNERLLASVFAAVGGPSLQLPLRRIAYDEAIANYGTDRPDLRFGLELVDLTELLAETEFKVFRGVVESGGVIKGINAGARDVPRSVLDGFIARAQELGAKGLVWAFREGEGWRSPTAKFLSAEELKALNERFQAEEGDLLLVVADQPATANSVLAQLRLDLAERFELVDPEAEEFCWVVDWPMFQFNESEGRWDPLHHPFTAPADPDAFDPQRAGEARALAYDVVWNGQELGGGSIRISSPELQQKVLEAIGIDAAEAEERFGFLLEALRYGAPPHGGIAYGLDRMVQRLLRADSIRDVIAFPKAASGADPLTGAPAPVDEPQLRELGLNLRAAKPKTP